MFLEIDVGSLVLGDFSIFENLLYIKFTFEKYMLHINITLQIFLSF